MELSQAGKLTLPTRPRAWASAAVHGFIFGMLALSFAFFVWRVGHAVKVLYIDVTPPHIEYFKSIRPWVTQDNLLSPEERRIKRTRPRPAHIDL